jgi:4-hydroxy 2-oxovalerate aldolase
LDSAGVQVIEVSHGDGLGGSSFNYGFSGTDEFELISAAVAEATAARIAVLLLPGVGTIGDLQRAHDCGAQVARIATHCTDADTSVQHFAAARALGMETVGFLMLSHRIGPTALAAQARIMVDAGAQCVYVVDSAGALVLGDAQARVKAVHAEIGHQAQVGFHGHQNLSLGVAISVLAAQNGALQIDGALCALGAGAGNAPTEVVAATFDRLGIPTDIDVQRVMQAAEDIVRPMMPRLPWMDRAAITQGYAGVYSSFLLHAERPTALRSAGPRNSAARRRARLRRRPGRHDHRRRRDARRRTNARRGNQRLSSRRSTVRGLSGVSGAYGRVVRSSGGQLTGDVAETSSRLWIDHV